MLTSKQRSNLKSIAANLSPIAQLGKGGIGDNMIRSLSDALEAHELIKINVLTNAEEDAKTRAEYMVSQEPYSYSDPDHGHAYFCDIDPSPYVAPDGTKYLLFNRNETGSVGTTTVWGMKMNEWWEPDYSSLRQLTETYYNTVDDVTPANRNPYEETHINEGPFLVDYTVDGKT